MKKFHLLSLIVSILLTANVKSMRTMMGEPLNPGDFEKSFDIEDELPKDEFEDGTAEDIKPDKIHSKIFLKAGNEVRKTRLWHRGIVPYLLDSSFSQSDRLMIAKSVSIFHEVTCLRLVARVAEKDYVVLKKSPDSYCASNVGLQGGRQSTSLGQRCIDASGSTVHEFMHLIGFQHEQSREDRDNYVNVFFKNIQSGADVNFRKMDAWVNRLGPYDPKSITHYSNFAFSKNGQPTIEWKPRALKLGQRLGLTPHDIDKINRAYNCTKGHKTNLKYAFRNKNQGNCFDFDPAYCGLWSRMGHCVKSPMFMTVSCQKTCGKCEMGCVDMRKECLKWTRRNYCFKFPDYMLQYCKYSCGICN